MCKTLVYAPFQWKRKRRIKKERSTSISAYISKVEWKETADMTRISSFFFHFDMCDLSFSQIDIYIHIFCSATDFLFSRSHVWKEGGRERSGDREEKKGKEREKQRVSEKDDNFMCHLSISSILVSRLFLDEKILP